jgi:DNA-binding CsgD family transcriptional regulator
MPRTIASRPAVPASRGRKAKQDVVPIAPPQLSNRERQVLSMLADGASGAQIADVLVLSPETVRTHIGNAMSKLGASSRAQAVAIALRRGELEESPEESSAPAGRGRDPVRHSRPSALISPGTADSLFRALLGALVALPDVDAGAVFVVDEDGLTMRRVALAGEVEERRASSRAIRPGEGPVGRAALERTPQLAHVAGPPGARAGRTMMSAPMSSSDRVVGVISLTTRPSRLTARSELLLLQAFADQVADIIVSRRRDRGAQLRAALEALRSSWTGCG